MKRPIEVRGGAGPAEVAAILAALARLAEEEAAAGEEPGASPVPGAWALSARPGAAAEPPGPRPGAPGPSGRRPEA